ncbi:putative L-ascorbate peroxidase 7, chloroplastic, variant 2 [Trebouxia sp. C0010 RCD-2024]
MAQTGHVLANRQFVGAQGLKSARAIRGSRPRRLVISNAVGTQTAKRTTKKEALQDAREDVRELIKSKHCNPILVRVAWHDSGTYDKDIAEFPQRGGANGSIRFYPEITHAANAGIFICTQRAKVWLKEATVFLEPRATSGATLRLAYTAGLPVAVKLLKKVADKYDGVSYADLFQMASAQAIELAGGPHIPLRYGRTDAATEEECAPEGRLPDGEGPFPGGVTEPGDHLRKIFYRMGLNDQEIVALSGAHTLGRVRKDRSGFGKEKTKYTEKGPGTPGGTSWTIEWLKFDNSYFKDVKRHDDPDLVVLATDECLFADEGFRPYAEKYAESQDAFFEDYAKAHLKLSELGVQWDPEPIEFDA